MACELLNVLISIWLVVALLLCAAIGGFYLKKKWFSE